MHFLRKQNKHLPKNWLKKLAAPFSRGVVAHKGKVTGRVTLIKYGDNAFARLPELISNMPEENILVADTTAPELLMACTKAAAILTNQGGMMSHAAIISRELNIPCIVGLKNITDNVCDGDLVEVDADNGIVRILSPQNLSKN